MPSETVEAVPVGAVPRKHRLKVQDLETEDLPEEETAPATEDVPEADQNTIYRKSPASAEKACA